MYKVLTVCLYEVNVYKIVPIFNFYFRNMICPSLIRDLRPRNICLDAFAITIYAILQKIQPSKTISKEFRDSSIFLCSSQKVDLSDRVRIFLISTLVLSDSIIIYGESIQQMPCYVVVILFSN